MSVHLSSIRLICDDEEYTTEYQVSYIPVSSTSAEIKEITTSEWYYGDNPLDNECCKVGHQFTSISFDIKRYDTWEVVFTDLFLPQQSSNRTYTGVIICGCKLINSRPVEESDKKIVQAFDDWDENGNPIFQEIEVLLP